MSKFCHSCGAEMRPAAVFCPQCGVSDVPQAPTTEASNTPSQHAPRSGEGSTSGGKWKYWLLGAGAVAVVAAYPLYKWQGPANLTFDGVVAAGDAATAATEAASRLEALGESSDDSLTEATIALALEDKVKFLPCVEWQPPFIHYINGQRVMGSVPNAKRFPITIERSFVPLMGGYADDEPYQELIPFQEAGILTSSIDNVVQHSSVRDEFVKFELTDFGKLVVNIQSKTDRNGQKIEIAYMCDGVGKVDRVVNFTIPSNSEVKSSIIDYTWRASPISTSGGRGIDQSIWEILKQRPPQSGADRKQIILTNNGWIPSDN